MLSCKLIFLVFFTTLQEHLRFIFSVGYIIRNNNIRIISARIASHKERLLYGQKTTIG